MNNLRTINEITLASLCALAMACSNAGHADIGAGASGAGGKADDSEPALAWGGSTVGYLDGSSADTYPLQLPAGCSIAVSVRVTSGDIDPEVQLVRASNETADRDEIISPSGELAEAGRYEVTFDIALAGDYTITVGTASGTGEYEVGLECAEGLCDVAAEAEPVCDWGNHWPVAEYSIELSPFAVESSIRSCTSEADFASQLQIEQAWKTFLITMGHRRDEGSIFDLVNDGTIMVYTVQLSESEAYDVVKYENIAENESGVIFEAGTTRPVAEIADGDLKGCVVPE